ncbi:MAG: alcohol dehydrogenase catalytic domain-containing protein [Nitrospirae bacterium]|nr:alcohol dehydrogenase catalytic domain-containing protein [Nitrospirota bacterium]
MYYSNNDIRLKEMPVPEAGRGEIVIRIHASGICGSDVLEWYRAGKTPLVLGHEIAGEIVEVGDGVTSYRKGQRVSASHHVPCNTCHYCLSDHHSVCETLRTTKFYPGGFSEYVRLPQINVDRGVYLLPSDMSYEEATFIEPLGCVLRGQRFAKVSVGSRVLIIGSGISGLLHIQLAKALGASLVVSTDVKEFRLNAAKRLGADEAIHASKDIPLEFRKLNGRGADVVILTTGAPNAIEQALSSVDRGGTVLFFAPSGEGYKHPIPINDLFWRKEITLTSSYAANYNEHMTALELIHQGKVNVREMITHRLPLSEAQKGFQLVEKGDESIKVIIEPWR